MADYTVVQGMLQSKEVPVVTDMMGTVSTISFGISNLRLTMLVKRNGKQHGQVNQQQQPGASEPLIAERSLHHGYRRVLKNLQIQVQRYREFFISKPKRGINLTISKPKTRKNGSVPKVKCQSLWFLHPLILIV